MVKYNPVKVFMIEPIFDENGKVKYTGFINGVASPFYRKVGTNEILQGSKFAGAIIDANIYGRHNAHNVYPDGRSLVVTLPSLEHWYIDGPSSNDGNGWVRTGSVEDGTLNVTPSILTPKYHGWIKDGFLVEC